MNLGAPALLLAAAGVGFGHAILPDHWMPLAVVGRTRRYPLRRVARISLLAGFAHVLVSVVLGAVIVLVGLQFRHTVQSAQDTVVGVILVLTGVAFAAIELTGRGHHHGPGGHHHGPGGHTHGRVGHAHHDHDHSHDHEHPDPPSRLGGLASIMVPFGAAASPDLTILPVFLAACASGVGAAVGSVAVFAAVTIATIVGLTVVAARGGYQVRGAWLERWGNGVTALVLIGIGALVLAHIL
jgi:nickel/cobalt transporter (NicO) family protein